MTVTYEDRAVVIPATSLAANDTDADGDTLAVTAVGTATHGTVTLAGGAVTFTPEANFFGAAKFGYTVSDGTHTSTSTVTVMVNPVDDEPTAVADTVRMDEDAVLVIPATALVANDIEVDGDTLAVTAVGTATHGTLMLVGGDVTFIPEVNFHGTVTFEYTVSDGPRTSTSTVTVMVDPLDDAPTAVADTVRMDEDAVLVIPAPTLVANDIDVDGDTLVVTAVGTATHGTVTLAGGDVTFTPEANFFGDATFEYTVSDGSSVITSKVQVLVDAVRDAPVAVPDFAYTNEDTEVVIPQWVLTENDVNIDGPARNLMVAEVGTATHGLVKLANGRVTFTPEANFSGTAMFEYTLSDGVSTSTTTVTVTVYAVNDAPPVAVADSVVTNMDTVLDIPTATLLANDSDVDGDSLWVSQVANAHNGTVEHRGIHMRFTPTPGFGGTASFEYQVSDPYGGTATGTVTVRVRDYVAKSVVAGEGHTCAVFKDGRVKCWGWNAVGQLGLGQVDDRGDGPNEMGSSLPFVRLGAGQQVTSLALGHRFTCALLESGAVKCWGYNADGRLGLGDTENRGDGPGEMDDALPPVDLGTGRTAKALAVGFAHACALLDDDTVKCWGDNTDGQLGLGDREDRGDDPGEMGDALLPVDLGTGRTAKAFAMGDAHTCALLDDGTVKCWGDNAEGQLGLGDTQDRGDGPGEMGGVLPPVGLGAGRTARALAAGRESTCALLDDGSVKCWGDNEYGQLGLGDSENRGEGPGEMADALSPVNLGTGRTAKALDVGVNYTCALLDDATIKCWGSNGWNTDGVGQLGLGDIYDRGQFPGHMGDALPRVNLGTGRTATSLTMGAHACATLDDGSARCWGNNRRGQLGLGDTEGRGDRPGEMGDGLPAIDW